MNNSVFIPSYCRVFLFGPVPATSWLDPYERTQIVYETYDVRDTALQYF